MNDFANTPQAPLVAGARTEPASLGDRVRSLRLPDQPRAAGGSRGVVWLLGILCLLLTAGLAYVGYSLYETRHLMADLAQNGGGAGAKAGGTAAPAEGGNAPAPVAAAGEVVLESKGYIIPRHKIQVSPKVGGMVVTLDFEEGKHVQKDDILAVLERVDYEAEFNHADAFLASARQRLNELTRSHKKEIEQAQAETDEAEAQRKQLQLDYQRNLSLRSGGALAARDYEQAESAYRAMDMRVKRLRLAKELLEAGPRIDRIEATKAEVLQAEADRAKAEWRLDNCTVCAPVSGVILTKKAEEGDIVNPIAFNISASLCEMADLSDLEVDLTIQERDVARVRQGQHCRVRSEAFPERVYDGTVSRLMPIADRAKGAVPVRVKILTVLLPKEEAGRGLKDEEGKFLKPEMGAIVSFLR
jgi:HlyD family secretion protein